MRFMHYNYARKQNASRALAIACYTRAS